MAAPSSNAQFQNTRAPPGGTASVALGGDTTAWSTTSNAHNNFTDQVKLQEATTAQKAALDKALSASLEEGRSKCVQLVQEGDAHSWAWASTQSPSSRAPTLSSLSSEAILTRPSSPRPTYRAEANSPRDSLSSRASLGPTPASELPRSFTQRMDFEKQALKRLEEDRPQSWYLVSTAWLEAWKGFVLGRLAPPGPIDNNCLLENGCVKDGLQPARDYRGLSLSQWAFLHMTYGGGPAIATLRELSPQVLVDTDHTCKGNTCKVPGCYRVLAVATARRVLGLKSQGGNLPATFDKLCRFLERQLRCDGIFLGFLQSARLPELRKSLLHSADLGPILQLVDDAELRGVLQQRRHDLLAVLRQPCTEGGLHASFDSHMSSLLGAVNAHNMTEFMGDVETLGKMLKRINSRLEGSPPTKRVKGAFDVVPMDMDPWP